MKSNEEIKELQRNMEHAMDCRSALIIKYDPEHKHKEVINEIKWIEHIYKKLKNNWIPDSGEVSLEVYKTVEFGLFLRREFSAETNPAIIGIDVSKDSTVIHVNFNQKK